MLNRGSALLSQVHNLLRFGLSHTRDADCVTY
ncbi:hypothetical protein SAMN04488540_10729 [Ferrimonas sediminum]|uniref:Uncharacterized protein n=1 Tax=Ferrimonas sediminum TaxID=718193 RepID=A0A1G8SW25_9GAMM|nr:hypothetical protein SAMN04488540_10729 [Ferrimonas sediminum]